MRRPLPTLAALVLPLLTVAAVAAEAAPLPPRPTEEICRELEKTIASMPAFAVDYVHRSEPDAALLQSQGRPVPKPYRNEYRWRAAGEKFYLWIDENRPAVPPYAYIFDGVTPLHFESNGSPGFKTRRSLTVLRNYANVRKPTVQLGMSLPTAKPTLLEAIRSPAAEPTGVEQIAGAPCYRFDIRRVEPNHNSSPLWVTAWLDPEKGMLPRRVMEVYDPAEIDPYLAKIGLSPEKAAKLREDIRDVKFDWETEEFIRVPNPAAETGESWFPKRAVYRQSYGRQYLEVEHVELRKEPAPDWFLPPEPLILRR